MDPMVWIVIGVVALIIVIALIALVARNSNRRKLTEAAELRRSAREREQHLAQQDAVAREHEHRAGAAEQEARAKAAEADKLRAQAEHHRGTLDEQERDVRRMEQTAEKLDPRHRADDLDRDFGRDRDRVPGRDHDRGASHGDRVVDEGRGRPDHQSGVTEPGTGARTEPGMDPGPGAGPATASGTGIDTGATARQGVGSESTARPGVAPEAAGVSETGTAGTGGRHARVDDPLGPEADGETGRTTGTPGKSAHPTTRPDDQPGAVDKLLGRTRRGEPRR
ncbi:hypothetical protein [Dietzia sp. ANT_WB102]|uniref:hypothetical protein n=1 Tax=Dietzia sp. ANT_WB102 TaxID=2597345 RepID=UPI0011ECA2A0|nr:hypothetical protein [Dietzia sp. ANT_WB102]KAA0919395.1 hypothetical protein FQ137_09175 [Dietzia sp. ANT_WB102]